MKKAILCQVIVVILCAGVGLGRAAEEVSFTSLLEEMVDRDRLARWPQPAYTCKQFSSYDRGADTPGADTWWANMDRSYFVRVEENQGRQEHVLMDATGPGSIVRFWATWHGPGGGPFSNGTMRVYFDGETEPAIVGPMEDLLDKGLLAGPPLSQGVSPLTDYRYRGHNLYLPIPYAERCKITYETDVLIDDGGRKGEALYYQINYRTYDKGVRVRTFDLEELKPWVGQKLPQTQEKLVEYARVHLASISAHPAWSGVIAPTKSHSFELKGRSAIRSLALQLAAEDLPQALRSTVLKIAFDGKQTVWCPVGDFFGTGYQIHPTRTWYSEVTRDGRMTCFWVMPFRERALITIENLGGQAVQVKNLAVQDTRWDWDDNSLLFHADWQQWHRIETKANTHARDHGASDLNWLTVQGQGVYVGDTLTLYNGADAWWGEGDEKIYVDGESFPSHFGTGTEDYYGYAWCNPNTFQAPFHAQPTGLGNIKHGMSVNSRYRALDAIPFRESLQFDMELWHWAKTRMNYAPVTFWYGRADARSQVKPMPDEAKRKVARVQEDVVEVKRVPGALEGESLTIKATGGGTTEHQGGAQFNWSGSRQLWWRDGKVGESLVLEFPVEASGTFDLIAALVKAVDYGIVSIAINGQILVESLDLYHTEVITREVSLGTVALKKGVNQMVVTVVGANPQAVKRYMFGLDYLLLKRP